MITMLFKPTKNRAFGKPLSVVLLLLAVIGLTGAKEEKIIRDSDRYFPMNIGLQWTYSGSVSDQMQQVSEYTNTAVIKGRTKKRETPVVVIWESNPSDRGVRETYFLKDKEGLTYFGGSPTTDFEAQLIPYKAMPFPIVLGKTVVQIEKTGLTYDVDLDHDGIEEKADTRSEITATAIETITTPAGTFQDTIRFQGKMTVWIKMSRDQKRAAVVSTTTHWFAKDVGMVKQIEKIAFPEGIANAPGNTITTEILSDYSKPVSPT
jgi:hypothetical protein